jgi:tRNA-splicing ligase RtcB
LGICANDLPDGLEQLHHLIQESIPAGVGRGHLDGARVSEADATIDRLLATRPDWDDRDRTRAYSQFASLGSGNHFIELSLDEHDDVWAVLHSGSRGIGNALATKHIECAKGLMRRYFIELDDQDLAYLVEGTDEFQAYIDDME